MQLSETPLRSYSKKLTCPTHGNNFTFKCQYQYCEKSFVCGSPQCLQEHFHKQNQYKLVLSKFDTSSCVNKMAQLQRILTKQDFAIQAKQLKSFIDELKSSMVSIYKDYKELHSRKQSLFGQLNKPFQMNIMDKVDQTINLGHHLRQSLDTLRSKINISNHQNQQHNYSFSNEKSQIPSTQNPNNKVPQEIQRPIEKIIRVEVKQKYINQPIQLENQQKNHTPEKSNVNGHSQKKSIINQNQCETFDDLFKNNKNNHHHLNESNRGSSSSQIQVPILAIYQRDFYMKRELTIFLEKNIKNFSWGTAEQVYSWEKPLKSIQKFHQMLQSRKNLLFIFICQNKILGSYYPSRYPRLTQKLRNDPQSFLFLSNENKQLMKFKAVNSQFHLSVSQKLYICHGNTPSYADGIRTFEKNFNSITYCLPSVSYKLDNPSVEELNKNHSGSLKIKQFYIFQIQN